MAAAAFFVVAIAATVIGLAALSRDALLVGLVAGLGALLLLVTGAVRSGRTERQRER